jgi:hypothetical protein
VFVSLEAARNPQDTALPVVSRLDRTTDTALEVSDSTLKVQGVWATVFVEF